MRHIWKNKTTRFGQMCLFENNAIVTISNLARVFIWNKLEVLTGYSCILYRTYIHCYTVHYTLPNFEQKNENVDKRSSKLDSYFLEVIFDFHIFDGNFWMLDKNNLYLMVVTTFLSLSSGWYLFSCFAPLNFFLLSTFLNIYYPVRRPINFFTCSSILSLWY